MAIQYPVYRNTLTKEDMGIPDYAEALNKGFNLMQNLYKSIYTPRNLENEAVQQEYANKIKEPYANNALRAFEADIGGQEAGAGINRENTLKQHILNEYLKEREPAEIQEIKERANYYARGGPGGSTGSKDYQNYVAGVANDNPNLTPQQLTEATDVIARGGTTLKDGTQLNPMSFGTSQAFNRAVKSGTTAAQINTANFANQAEAELDVFNDYTTKWIAPYATTYFGHSPEQIADSFKNDDKSQDALGKLIAANTLEYEKAQIRNRIAAGQPGITATHQLVDEAQQYIRTSWPRLSAKARLSANNALNEAIKAGLQARNKVGVGAGATYTRQFEPNGGVNARIASENPNSPQNTEAFIKQMSDQLIRVMPKATPEAIKETAALRKITPEQVIRELIQRAKAIQGAR
jgi:hypothetical protein